MSASEQPNDETARGSEDVKAQQPAAQSSEAAREVPLFLRKGSDGYKGNAQDEKDEVGE